jgi:hypothetical protein
MIIAIGDGFSANGSQVRHVPDGLRSDVRRSLAPELVRPVTVVLDQVIAEHQTQVAVAKDQDPVQEFTAGGPDDQSRSTSSRCGRPRTCRNTH